MAAVVSPGSAAAPLAGRAVADTTWRVRWAALVRAGESWNSQHSDRPFAGLVRRETESGAAVGPYTTQREAADAAAGPYFVGGSGTGCLC